ncbi:hypothetical protein K502DRAFT_333339 [Neoconidiobolus thromboides FSU 785]|nr:hypothetical protein K502DRAFT_333339 [Neoconidiobolus thromboides FSU 785]
MYKINIFMILLLLLSTSVTSNEFEKMKKVNKDFIKSSTILYDQILLVYNTVKRKEINSKEEVNENEVRLNNSHFLVNLTSTINLNQIYSKASLKKNVIVNIKDLHFFVHENNLNAVATLDKFHSNNKFMPINHWYLGLFTISLDKESWNIKNNAFGYYANTYSGKSISKVGDMLYIYGGWSLDLDTSISRLSNNFTVFDLTNNNTFRYGVEVDSNMPPNAFHTATMINSTTMVILGGVPYEKLNEINPGSEYNPNNASYSKELTVSKLKYIYIYNTAAERYMKVKTKDYDDRVRMGHSATYLSDMNCILVYGGTDKVNNYTILYNDIQLLNLTDWKWTKIIIKDFNDEVFNVGRAWHSNELINNKVVFFYGDINYYNYNYNYDIIVIDLESLNLEKKTIKLSDTIGPAIKRENEDFSQLYTSNEYLKYNLDTSRYNLYSSFSGSEIAGILFY